MSHSHHPQGFLGKYVFSFDHKVIGIQYIVTAMMMALVGGALALMIRMQITWPGKAIVSPETYLSLVTMHGTIMIFFVVSLALVSGLGNFVIPLQVGAKDMAYPLLNMLSYWVIVPACALMVGSFFVEGGAASAGWTSYPPLSAVKGAVPGSQMGQTLWLLAMALFIVSFTMGGLNYLTTILCCRAPGLSMMRLPLVIWHFLLATILGLLSFPALTAAAVLLLFDRHLGTSFYLPSGLIIGDTVLKNGGGTPLLFQHLFWFLGHPEVYVLVLPAVGVAFDVIPTFTRRPPFGYRVTVTALMVIGVLSMIVWGHHMFLTGMNPYVGEYFSVATVLITVPFAVLGVNLLASLWRGRIRLAAPMLFALGLISTIGAGGFGGLYLGTATSDIYLHDTYFVVGHFHLMIGVTTLLATFAGIYYWFPKMFGRHMNETFGKIHFWLTYAPMLLLFVSMHLQGLGGALRRQYDPTSYEYARSVREIDPILTALAIVVVSSQSIFVVNFVWSAFKGKKAAENPWEATTLEWTTPSPAPHGNWDATPVVTHMPYVFGKNGAKKDYVMQGQVPEREKVA